MKKKNTRIAETITKLWGQSNSSGRLNLTIEKIVDLAIDMAQKKGLASVSFRKIAVKLGVGTMTLYSYVSSKEQLIELMVDNVFLTSIQKNEFSDFDSAIEQIAEENFNLFLKHPWLLDTDSTRPILGRGSMSKYDSELRRLDMLSISDRDKDALLTLLIQHAESSARKIIERNQIQKKTKLNELEWWAICAPILNQYCDSTDFPFANRIGAAAGAENNGAHDFRYNFKYGLKILAKGVQVV